ncbi:MAG TPA: hypothetical protein VK850_06655 [Candidatus Binatia bacterium]|nr:hypothetical protein [Candidatus Binatia bacterium]
MLLYDEPSRLTIRLASNEGRQSGLLGDSVVMTYVDAHLQFTNVCDKPVKKIFSGMYAAIRGN